MGELAHWTGNQLTVEALIYESSLNTIFNTSDIVSKHHDPGNVNYLLRTDYAYITAGGIEYQTPAICQLSTNQIYHIAMVYDGVSLRFYRNGFLMSQIAATGNLFQNNFNTRIACYDNPAWNTQFFGYVNEVRIWNVARTQAQLNAAMFNLPTPTTQTGLLGYYTFNSLLNKQGNGTFNGTLDGTTFPVINTNVPNCSYIPDSCGVVINPPADCSDTCYWKVTGNNIIGNNNIFGTMSNNDINIKTNSVDRGILTATGRFGWNTTSPTAVLHNNGTVRLENLPSGSGNPLVVDRSGNVMVSQGGTGSGIINADQGLTSDGTTVVLGDDCNNGGGQFSSNREINMNNNNLYFNSSNTGKIFMGNTASSPEVCSTLFTRLEISSDGLRGADNSYTNLSPSASGLRFSNLNSGTDPIKNRSGGVLSLDEEGDVIWVRSCCNVTEEAQLKDILARLTKLENELKATKEEASSLKQQLNQMDVLLTQKNTIVLNQNVPNPFEENTTITYFIPKAFHSAQIIFTSSNGEVIKTTAIKQPGKGQVNVFAKDISSGLYTYTLTVDGKTIETKKMIKH